MPALPRRPGCAPRRARPRAPRRRTRAPHRLAVAELAPQLLLEDLRVLRDHRVGRAQDVAGAAVVLLQRDDLQLRVVQRQALQVVDGGAAPAVDALVVVAHRGERRAALAADQRLQQLVLHGVGVLVLVDQHVAELRLPLLARLGVALQQLQRQADQVVEVHRLVGLQALLYQPHHARGDALVVVGGARRRRVGVQALVLPQADGPLPAPRQRVVGAAAGVADHAQHVVAVEDGELLLQARARCRRCAACARPGCGRC
jgi:hypothetical protein